MTRRRSIRRSAGTTLLLLAACGSGAEGPEDEAEAASTSPPFQMVGDVQEIMLHVVEPAAAVYWDAVGWVVDASGVQEIRPEDDEAWEAVENAAWVVAESGNLLLMEGRAVDEGPWTGMSIAMTEVARRALAAAEARDEAEVFELGGQLYQACTACHATYAVETLRPNTRLD